MRLVHISHDEVNRWDATRMAPAGMTIEPCHVLVLPDGRFDGFVYDLELWPLVFGGCR
jgi:hypothetical protein